MRPRPVIRAWSGAVVAVVLVVLGATVSAVGAPAAPPKCPDGTVPSQSDNGWLCVPAQTPPVPGLPPGENPGGSGSTPRVCRFDYTGEVVPCSDEYGIWDSARQCYAFEWQTPFAPDDPIWKGNDPEEGSIWGCDTDFASPRNTWFVPHSENPADPGTVAERVVESIPLVKPTVRMSPRAETYVGLETWLWVNPSEWRTVTGSAAAGGTVVTVKAEPLRVVWDLGGERTACSSAGRPWTTGMGASARTDCSHVFRQTSNARPNGVLPVTTQIIYSATWTCSGACSASSGSLGEVNGFVSDPLAVRVGEIQSIVIRTGVGR